MIGGILQFNSRNPDLSISFPKLHIANTFFESELDNDLPDSLFDAFHRNAFFHQLQFLPVLYAAAEDGILVTEIPLSGSFYSYDDALPFKEIESWGASRLIARFAKERGIQYDMPPWDVVKEVNSKRYSFDNSPKLPGAELLTTETQVQHFLKSIPGNKVLKTCFGVSGKGHLILEELNAMALSFLHREWEKGLPVIGEPWVKRDLDFSTQWLIDKNITYLGATTCVNDGRGQYRSTIVHPENHAIPFLREHQDCAKEVLTKMKAAGFFGNVGIDAMIYDSKLHPIVEINARKTMGWVALQFQRQHHPDKVLHMQFSRGQNGFLPDSIELKSGKRITFPRNLTIDIYN